MWQKFFDHSGLSLGRLGAGANFFLQAVAALLQRREIGEHKFRINHFNVAHRINRSTDVMNVAAFETAHDLHNRVYLTNVTQELIAQPFAAARAFHETGYVDELDRGG